MPQVIGRADVGEDLAVLLDRLPGLPAAVLALRRPELATVRYSPGDLRHVSKALDDALSEMRAPPL